MKTVTISTILLAAPFAGAALLIGAEAAWSAARKAPARAAAPRLGHPCQDAHLTRIARSLEPKYGKFINGYWDREKQVYDMIFEPGPQTRYRYLVKLSPDFARVINATVQGGGNYVIGPSCRNENDYRSAAQVAASKGPPAKVVQLRDLQRGGAYVITTGPGAAPRADQFDLVCSVYHEEREQDPDGRYPPVQRRNVTMRFRIDLQANKACTDACTSIAPFQRITPELLTLSDSRSGRGYLQSSINRLDGTYNFVFHDKPEAGGYLTITEKGNCEKAPFTPFPRAKF